MQPVSSESFPRHYSLEEVESLVFGVGLPSVTASQEERDRKSIHESRKKIAEASRLIGLLNEGISGQRKYLSIQKTLEELRDSLQDDLVFNYPVRTRTDEIERILRKVRSSVLSIDEYFAPIYQSRIQEILQYVRPKVDRIVRISIKEHPENIQKLERLKDRFSEIDELMDRLASVSCHVDDQIQEEISNTLQKIEEALLPVYDKDLQEFMEEDVPKIQAILNQRGVNEFGKSVYSKEEVESLELYLREIERADDELIEPMRKMGISLDAEGSWMAEQAKQGITITDIINIVGNLEEQVEKVLDNHPQEQDLEELPLDWIAFGGTDMKV